GAALRFAGAVSARGVEGGALGRALIDRFGPSPPIGRHVEIERLVEDGLLEEGYRHAHATSRADIDHHDERATLVVTIEPGARTLVGDVRVAGDASVAAAQLSSELRLMKGAPYRPDALSARIQRYVESRRSRGYYEAKVVPTVQLADADRVANVTLTVTPGPHMRVVFAGDPLPSDQRDVLVPVE